MSENEKNNNKNKNNNKFYRVAKIFYHLLSRLKKRSYLQLKDEFLFRFCTGIILTN